MGYSVEILLDSMSPAGCRLTTYELTYPRFIHAEILTHRAFSRSSSSSRAIPIERLIQRVIDDPVIPVSWGRNRKGMQAGAELDGADREAAVRRWLLARDQAVLNARELQEIGVHKQIVNRLIEPWMWITVICTATEYGNFFYQRVSPLAQPEIEKVARMMLDAYTASCPTQIAAGDWHLPFVRDDERDLPIETQLKLSAGRSARVSYLTHDGRHDPSEDMALHDKLVSAKPGHWSPLEHQAMALSEPEPSGNFVGWKQYRKFFKDENHDVIPGRAPAVP
mgnify:CR=1 FL=1